MKIYSNLNLDDMIQELRNNFKGVTNKEYIENSLYTHRKYNLINDKELKQLYNEFINN